MIDGIPTEFDRIYDSILIRRENWRKKHPRTKKRKSKIINVMTRTSILRKTPDWEKARPEWAIYEHFFYNDNGLVRKVEGLVEKNRLVKGSDGVVETLKGYTEVRWDGSGCCFDAVQNVRRKQYDIRFD